MKKNMILIFSLVATLFFAGCGVFSPAMKAKDGSKHYTIELNAYLDAMPGPDVAYRSPYITFQLMRKDGENLEQNWKLIYAKVSNSKHEQVITNFDNNELTGKGSPAYMNALRSLDQALGEVFDVYFVFQNELEETFSLKAKQVTVEKVY